MNDRSPSNDSLDATSARAPGLSRRIASGAAKTVRTIVVAYLIVLLLLILLENRLIYVPSKYPDGDWSAGDPYVENVAFESGDGTQLHGWFAPHPNPRVVLLFAHGNAGNVTHRAGMLCRLFDLGASVFVFDYRGYGKSDGAPDEPGILADTRAARSWLAERTGVEPRDVVLLGRSLGGAAVVRIAAEDGARGLILENTFTSLPEVVARLHPWIPAGLLMRNRYDALAAIAHYDGPLLAAHGDADELVPCELGRRLFDAAPCIDKTFHTLPGGGHNDPPDAEYYRLMDQFFDRISKPTAPR